MLFPYWMKRKIFYIPTLIVIAVLGVFLISQGDSKQAAGEKKVLSKAGTLFEVVEVKKGNIEAVQKVSGRIEADRKSVLRSEVSGRVVYVEKDKSREIKKGEILVQIANESIDLELRSAQDALTLARQDLENTKISNQNRIKNAEFQKKQAEDAYYDAVKNKENIELQRDAALKSIRDLAEIEYNLSYKAVEEVLRFWGSDTFDRFILDDIPNSNRMLLDEIKNIFADLKYRFLELPLSRDIKYADDLNEIKDIAFDVKYLNDKIGTFLNYTITDPYSYTQQVQGEYVLKNSQFAQSLSARLSSLQNIQSKMRDIELQYKSLLDSASSRLSQAETSLKLAENNLQIAKKQAEVNLLAAQSRFNQAESRFSQASIQKSKLFVQMPYTGYITNVYVDVGDNIGLGTPLLEVADRNTLKMTASLSLTYRDSLYEGKKVSIEGDEREYTISQISALSRGDREIGFEVYIGSDDRYSIGQVAVVDVPVVIKGVYILPLSSVIIDRDEVYVWVVKDGIVKRQNVVIQEILQDKVIISSGLKEGDYVIKFPTDDLREGKKVEIKEQ